MDSGRLELQRAPFFRDFGRLSAHAPLYGIFEVDGVVKNGLVQPPLLTDSTRWRRFATASNGALVRLATGSMVRFGLTTDSAKHLVTLSNGPDSTNWLKLSYAFSDTMHLAKPALSSWRT